MTSAEALKLIREAITRGRYFLEPHALRRMAQRGVSIHDVRHAVLHASACRPYSVSGRPVKPEFTAWRVSGLDFDGDRLALEVDLSQDYLGAFVAIITVF